MEKALGDQVGERHPGNYVCVRRSGRTGGGIWRPNQWRWSSAPARLQDHPGGDGTLLERIRESTRLGRPAAGELFLLQLGNTLGRNLLPRKPGRPRKPVACGRVDSDRTARATRRNWKRYGRPGLVGSVLEGQDHEGQPDVTRIFFASGTVVECPLRIRRGNSGRP